MLTIQNIGLIYACYSDFFEIKISKNNSIIGVSDFQNYFYGPFFNLFK